MYNYKIKLQYDGGRYSGWQKQGNTDNTIQAKLESLLAKLTGYEVEIHGSGRTDAGVHAYGQVANFKTKEKYKCEELFDYINRYLPDDIRVLTVDEVDERFHARLNAKKKEYIYKLDMGKTADVFNRKYSYHIPDRLDVSAMVDAANALVGSHDFKAFCDNKHMKKSTTREIYQVDIMLEDEQLVISYIGNGFLYHMVRLMTGALIDIGLGRLNKEGLIDILENGDRNKLSNLAPAQGLYLKEVWY